MLYPAELRDQSFLAMAWWTSRCVRISRGYHIAAPNQAGIPAGQTNCAVLRRAVAVSLTFSSLMPSTPVPSTLPSLA